LIKQAKKKGIRVTAETTPHYFTLTDQEVRTFDTNCKMNPPLRTQKDIAAIKKGLADGTIDVIATDHAPHSEQEKDVEFDNAPFGITGLETSLGLALQELVEEKVLTISQLVEKMSVNPARILGLNKGRLAVGYDADITIIDLERKWIVRQEDFKSKSKNSPFIGRKLKGMAVLTISRGKIVYESMA
jgi:dihydroorotase